MAFFLDRREWVLPLIPALAFVIMVGMWFLEHRKRVAAERELASPAVVADRAPRAIDIQPRIVRDLAYGPQGNESAYLIVARVKSADSVVHEEATGTLVSVEPLDASMKAVYEARGAFPSGLLQWSPLYGSNERARITPAGLDLNIFVFLETDDRGRAAYLDGSVHQRQDMIILDGYKWRVTIEVAADGAHAQCVFDVSSGSRDESNPLIIRASPEGTLYSPVITTPPQDTPGA